MAAGQASPSGFSYAQAAKGRSPAVAAQTPSSKMTSGAVTPATSAFSELSPGGNWADDVEASAAVKQTEPSPAVQDVAKPTEVKDSAVERAKTEEKAQSAPSGTSSPDLMASVSTTTKDDDSSAPTTGSSESTWETKSQVSEPSWIADREKRQAAASQASQKSDTTVKGDGQTKSEKNAKESSLPAPAPPSYQPAPPPPVNIWAKRAEEAKAKAFAQPSPPKPAVNSASNGSSQSKENQRPREDSRRKSASVSNVSRNTESTTQPASEPRRAGKTDQVRINNLVQHGTKASSREAESPLTTRNGGVARSSLPNVVTAQPLVKDEVTWPTPDLAQDADRKDSTGISSPDKQGEDDSQNGRRKKPEWEKMVVTPTIKWESQNARGHDGRRPPGSERGRGGIRGRGGLRGGANGTGPNDRPTQRGSVDESSAVTASRARGSADREAMPPPPKPNRAASETGSRPTVEATPEPAATRETDVSAVSSAADQAKPESTTSEQAAATSNWVANQSSMPCTASPAKVNGINGEVHDDEHVPAPIPRRTSVGTQTGNGVAGENGSRDGPSFRLVPSGHNKENRSFDSHKDGNFTGTPRGKGRGGRGRGGQNGYIHTTNYSNGEFTPSPGFGVPPSPSAYHQGRGNHYAYPSQSGRGGWPRGNSRAQSIPIDTYYGRSQNPYGPPQAQHVQGYGPPVYDYSGYPMTAIPYQASMDTLYIMGMVSMQLEYYFSIDNLLKDMFLRKNMDSQGFVLLDVVANFNRMKQLNTNRDLLKDVCINSETVEIRVGDDGKERLRRREGYEQFVLPTDQRDPGAQNDGPKQLQPLERHQAPPFMPGPPRGAHSAGIPGMQQQSPFARRSYDAGFTLNGMAPQFNGYPSGAETANGDDTRGRPAKSSMYGNAASQGSETLTNGQPDQEPDAFPDEQILTLTVMAKVKPHPLPHGAATRTFSNGSIDTRSIFSELEKSNGTHTPPTSTDESQTNGDNSASAASSAVRSPDRGPAPDMMIYWSKDQQAPSETVPRDLMIEPYVQLRHKALDQRSHAATGTCPYDLDVLYQFWSHFLLRNFNAGMYSEFQHYATQDAKTRHNTNGLQNLIKFYDQALLSSNAIRDRVAKDYGKLVGEEPKELEGAAFKQLRAAWRNGAMNLKNRKKMMDVLDPAVKARLDPINGDVTSPVS